MYPFPPSFVSLHQNYITLHRIKLFITDIDGVWTDGGMYYAEDSGARFKKFNTADSAGVLFLRLAGIPLAVITGEDSGAVRQRAGKLGIRYVFTGVRNKLQTADRIRKELGIDWDEVAFVGDDINDLPLLRKAGWSACPASAENYIKNEVDHILSRSGGQGAFREFVQTYFERRGELDDIIQMYLDQIPPNA